ncbi:MAG: type II toxin-antitoxin system HicB family antitoxin [Pseudomonadota bacterium]
MANVEMKVVEKLTAEDHARQPYTRCVTPQADGTYHAEIVELPGCFATGVTAPEAYEHLEDAALSWIAAALEAGQSIPPPMDEIDYSGKIVVRMPRSLHRKAAFLSKREDVSLNQFIVACIAEGVGLARKPVAPVITLQHVNGRRSDTLVTVLQSIDGGKTVKHHA